jgi:hypothetical protein
MINLKKVLGAQVPVIAAACCLAVGAVNAHAADQQTCGSGTPGPPG